MTDLASFLAQHATPYDSESDHYNRPPFAAPIKARISGIDDVHSYHTRVPPQGIEPYIKHYTEPSDLVLDPFCGSGTTGIASLRLKRRVILNDLSPAAIHISRNYCTGVDPAKLQKIFDGIMINHQQELDWLYSTVCDRCGNLAEIQYTIWSDVFECGRCGNEIILWDVAVDEENKEILDLFSCPSCQKDWSKSDLKRLRVVPVITNYECSTCNPKRWEHRTIDSELDRFQEISTTPIPYTYPAIPFDQSFEMWRRVHSDLGIDDSSKFFTKRNLWAFAGLWDAASRISDPGMADKLRFALTGSMPSLTVMTIYMPDRSGRGNRKGTLYVPSLSIEQNVRQVIKRRFKRIIRYVEQFREGDLITRVGSATDLSEIPTSSIDYVFTDPPFGSNIFYADVNFLWESWLGVITDQEHEAVVHVKHKNKNTLPDYERLMTEAFCEIHRVLKPGRWASIVFHNSDDKIWQKILDAVENAGLELAEINSFDKSHLSFKGIKGAQGLERVTNKDIVLNLRKPRPQEQARSNGHTHLAEAEQRVVETVADFLATNPAPTERTLQHIWNHALYNMLREGSVEVSMAGLEELLAYHYRAFKIIDGRYYLRGEAVVGGNIFDLRSDTGAIAWLNSVLGNEPQTTGDLIPKWQRETAALAGVDVGRLDRLLEENFWLDKKTGRWRIPTPEERDRMSARSDLSAQAHLRVVNRYLQGDLDRQPDDRELAAWVRFCYSREFYPEAAALFQHINEARLDPEEYKTVKKMAQVARLKSKQSG
jgi:DNA modification methylase